MTRCIGTLVCAASLAFVAGSSGCASAPAAPTADRGAVLFQNYCAQCHGVAAQGEAWIDAPAIAGLPQWYVTAQLEKFRGAVRGAHFDDVEGMRMRPMALTLTTEADVQSVAMFVSALPARSPPQLVTDAHPEAGKTHYATCTACHGADAAGNEQLGAPPLTVQPDWYLVRQLAKFKSGVRGTNPKDVRGAQMRPMSMTLPDEQAMKDVVAYIQTLRK